MLKIIKTHVFVFFIIFCSCQNSQVTSDTPDEGDSEIGIKIGNPTKALTFQTDPAIKNSGCSVYEKNPNTQKCSVTPDKVYFKILAIYAIKCLNQDQTEISCRLTNEVAQIERVALYEGDPVDLMVTQNESSFPYDLTLPSDSFNMGGIQMVFASIGFQFPNSNDNPDESKKVSPLLYNTDYHICYAPTGQQCLNSEAQFGDVLFDDATHDKIIGFVNTELLAADNISEIDSRPLNYSNFSLAEALTLQTSPYSDPAWEITGSEFYGTPGYPAPIIGLEEPVTISATQDFVLNLKIITTNLFTFWDGIPEQGNSKNDLCVAGVNPNCAVDSDPESTGFYHPFYDLFFAIHQPQFDAEFTDNSY